MLPFFKKMMPIRAAYAVITSRGQIHLLMVVERHDIDSVEKSSVYKGLYFVLGPMSVVEKNTPLRVPFQRTCAQRPRRMQKLEI